MTMDEYNKKLTELITREDAIKAACRAFCHTGVSCPDNYCCEIREAVFAIPAFVKRGEWIRRRDHERVEYRPRPDVPQGEAHRIVVSSWKCSNCGNVIFDYTPNYCENCGARMVSE